MSERLAELWSVLWAAVTSPKPLSWPVGDAALALNWPLLLLVLPLPWLLARRWQAYETRREALHTPFSRHWCRPRKRPRIAAPWCSNTLASKRSS